MSDKQLLDLYNKVDSSGWLMSYESRNVAAHLYAEQNPGMHWTDAHDWLDELLGIDDLTNDHRLFSIDIGTEKGKS